MKLRIITETESNKNFENERYLYSTADVYTPYTSKKPKLHEMGYFTNNMEAFDNLDYSKPSYVYGELIDYNDNCERRYRSDTKWYDPYGEADFYEENYAFYIPESSIPKEKQKWYRKHRANTPTYKGYFGPIDLEVEEYLYVHGAEQ